MFLWFMERPPRNKTSRIELLNLVGTARCAVRAAFSGATMPPADLRAGTSQRDVPTEVRFMGRRNLQYMDAHGAMNRSRRRKEADFGVGFLSASSPRRLRATVHGQEDVHARFSD